MPKPTLNDLTAFLTVATRRSFRQAADELGLSPSSLSHTIRGLEQELGVRLLNRTTRSVSPTEAGERLLVLLGPALRGLDAALAEIEDFRGEPRGTLRLNAPETAARLLLRHVVPTFLARYPDAAVDLVSEGRMVDIVAEGFDAGVRLGESVPQDMIAIHFGGRARFLALASPDYLERMGMPTLPEDLAHHRCIRHRMPSGRLYRWEFERYGQEIAIDAPGALTIDHIGLMLEAAADGLGIAFAPEQAARPDLEAGRLRPVLADWCPSLPGLYLYYPGRRRVPAILAAFIGTLKECLPGD